MSPSPRARVPVARRTARRSSPGSTTGGGPQLDGQLALGGYLAAATMVPAGVKARRAATVSRPRVPEPITATVSPSVTPAARAPCTAQAVGSTSTAASSVMSAGTGCSWLGWATIWVDQPPPVSQQNPDCRPGSRSPKAMRSQLPRSPRAHAGHGGEMARATQPRTGSSTTRSEPSVPWRSATTSWPGTNGNDTMGSK